MTETLNFTLGADPELTLLRTRDNSHISAGTLVRLLSSTNPDAFPSVQMGVKTETGIFGHDGHEATAELRPNPADSPKGLTDNIGRLIRVAEFISGGHLKAITDSRKEAVGGHIHIGIPSSKPTNVVRAVNWTLFLTSPLLRLTSETTRKKRTGYGNLNDVRYDNHGGATTAELRFLPGEWLTTPKTTEAVLSYVACMYYEALNNQEEITRRYSKFMKGSIDEFDINTLQVLEKNMPGLFSMIAAHIKKDVKKFACYEQYKAQINYALSPEKMLKDHQAIDFNAFDGWCRKRTPSPLALQQSGQATLEQFLAAEALNWEAGVRFSPEQLAKLPEEFLHLVDTQTKVVEFIEGGKTTGGQNIWNSGDSATPRFQNDLTNRLTRTGLPANVPVYICGLADNSGLTGPVASVVAPDSEENVVFNLPNGVEVSDAIIDRMTRVARSVYSRNSQRTTVIGIPWELRNLEEDALVRSDALIAEYYYKIQTGQLEFTSRTGEVVASASTVAVPPVPVEADDEDEDEDDEENDEEDVG